MSNIAAPVPMSRVMRTSLPRILLAALAALLVCAAPAAATPGYTNGLYTVSGGPGALRAQTTPDHPAGAGNLSATGQMLVHSYTSTTDYPLSSLTGAFSSLPDGYRYSFAVSGTDTLTIEQDLTVTGTTFEDSAVHGTIHVVNTGATPVTIGARMTAPLRVGSDPAPAFTPQGGAALSEWQRFTDPAFPGFAVQDTDQPSPTTRVLWSTGFGGEQADLLDFGQCCVGSSAPLVPESLAGVADIGADNEARWVWGRDAAHASTIAPGGSVTFGVSVMAVVASVNPNTTPPTISGTPQVGAPLAGQTGTWRAWPLTAFTYAWLRCDAAGDGCTPIAGATAAGYVPVAADTGHALRLHVWADGAEATSAATGPVTAAPVPPAPTPTPNPPKLTAVVGSGSGASDGKASVAAVEGGVDVGCTMTGALMTACRVDLYADPAGAHASSVVLIGTGTVAASKATGKLAVHVKLNKTGRALLRRSPGGVPVRVQITGKPVSGADLHVTANTRLVEHRSSVTAARFAINRAQLTPATQRSLRALATQLGSASSVRCAGYTQTADSRAPASLRALGLRRAKAVCAFLRAHGVRARLSTASYGATHPRASNATAAGRARNRRVVLSITR
jgi:outer membrane protein OmpA-like peptidoglycan-associated protein